MDHEDVPTRRVPAPMDSSHDVVALVDHQLTVAVVAAVVVRLMIHEDVSKENPMAHQFVPRFTQQMIKRCC